MHRGSVIQFMTLMDTNAPMNRIEVNYRALLAVAVVLNSQREMQSLWEAITGEITKVVPWARATVTLYDQEADGFKFYVIATTVALEELTNADGLACHPGRPEELGLERSNQLLEIVAASWHRSRYSTTSLSYLNRRAPDFEGVEGDVELFRADRRD